MEVLLILLGVSVAGGWEGGLHEVVLVGRRGPVNAKVVGYGGEIARWTEEENV